MAFTKNHWANIKNDDFENLCKILLNRMDPEIRPIEGSGGDEGIDSYFKTKNEKLIIYQVKFFPNKLDYSRKRQIKKSLVTAISTHSPLKWYLVVPLDPTPNMIKWFSDLQKEYSQTKLEWFGHTQISSELYKHPDLLKQFFSIGLIQFPKIPFKKPHIMSKILNNLKSHNQIIEVDEEKLNKNLRCYDYWEKNGNVYYLLISNGVFTSQIIISLSKNLQQNEIFAIYGSEHDLNLFIGKFPLIALQNNLTEEELINLILNN